MSTEEFIDELRNRRNWLIFLLVGIIILPLGFYIYEPFNYASESVFIISDNQALSPDMVKSYSSGSDPIQKPEQEVSRFYYMAKSTEMLRYLVNHFNLDTESGKPNEQSENIAIQNLQSKIIVKIGEYNAISVTVKNRDKLLAVDMTDELVNHLEMMNRNYIVEGIKRKIWVYDQIISEMKGDSDKSKAELNEMIISLRSIIEKTSTSSNKDIMEIHYQLNELNEKMSSMEVNIAEFRKIYSMAMLDVQNGNIKSINVIKEAMPDTKSPIESVIQVVLAAISVSILLAIVMIYLMWEYRRHFDKAFN